jgi:phosphoribosyl-ATP pyrophosphohydrolase/phosphoribosyl-AMP cyclohydrolase
MTDRTLAGAEDLDALAFDERGLVPVVAQDAASGLVLMAAWANREALETTLTTGQVHFWSRSRGELWRKGATSGHTLALVSLHADCDGDTVLARVRPAGPACHTGEVTCFGEGTTPARAQDRPGPPDTIDEVARVIRERASTRPEGSYTARLLADENLRLKKLGEETAELVLALARGPGGRVAEEAADLFYHLLVALEASGHSLDDVRAVLASRRT